MIMRRPFFGKCFLLYCCTLMISVMIPQYDEQRIFYLFFTIPKNYFPSCFCALITIWWSLLNDAKLGGEGCCHTWYLPQTLSVQQQKIMRRKITTHGKLCFSCGEKLKNFMYGWSQPALPPSSLKWFLYQSVPPPLPHQQTMVWDP